MTTRRSDRGEFHQAARPTRQLGLFDAVCIMVGIVIGVGIYESPPRVAANVPGPAALLLVWVLGGLRAFIGALCYAELATAYPRSGGDYVYLTRAYGSRVGFLYGWAELLVIRTGSIAAMAFVFSDYMTRIAPLGPRSPVLYAATIVGLLSLVNVLGVREGKWTQNALTVSKVVGLPTVAVIGVVSPFSGSRPSGGALRRRGGKRELDVSHLQRASGKVGHLVEKRAMTARIARLREARAWVGVWVGLALAAGGCAPLPGQDVPYVQTPHHVVDAMLRLAAVGKEDVIYDLGSGDGRIVIAAARDFGAGGVGIEIDPRLVAGSVRWAQRAGVAERVHFVQQDLFQTDLSPATVVTLYLSQELNARLRPKLLRELRAGARIVSYRYDMGGWHPERQIRVEADAAEHTVYLWVVPDTR